MGFISSFRKFWLGKEKAKDKKEKKLKALRFIENNSTKSNFIHWLINNTKGEVFCEEDDWEDIREKISESSSIPYSLLRSYAITLKEDKIAEEALEELMEETEEAEEVARRLTFLGRFKKLSIAIGGALLFLGIIKIIVSVVWLMEPTMILPLVNQNLKLAFIAFLVTAGIIDFLGGIFLSAM